MTNYAAFIAAGLLLTGNLMAGIALDTSLCSDSIQIDNTPPLAEYIVNTPCDPANELSVHADKIPAAPFCSRWFISEHGYPEQMAGPDIDRDTDSIKAAIDEIVRHSSGTAGGLWIDKLFCLESDPARRPFKDRIDPGTYQQETIASVTGFYVINL